MLPYNLIPLACFAQGHKRRNNKNNTLPIHRTKSTVTPSIFCRREMYQYIQTIDIFTANFLYMLMPLILKWYPNNILLYQSEIKSESSGGLVFIGCISYS